MQDSPIRTNRSAAGEALPPEGKPGPEGSAIVVLGCRVGKHGVTYGASERRVVQAARAHTEGLAPWIIVSGGKRWHGVSEADAFAVRLIALGVPAARVLRENRSQRTRQNARYVAGMTKECGVTSIFLVTCDWHLPRALSAFRHYGLDARESAAVSPKRGRAVTMFGERLKGLWDWLALRLERLTVLTALLVLFTAQLGCDRETKQGAPPAARGSAASEELPRATLIATILAAEQARTTNAVPADSLSHPAPRVREAAARALARIADAAAVERLLPALSDEHAGVTEYAAFGLGRARIGRQHELTRALVLRATTLQVGNIAAPGVTTALTSIAAALGRLETDEAERGLSSWLALPLPLSEAAALSLGQLGARRGSLGDPTLVALLEAAAEREAPTDAALYAFARVTPQDGLLVDRALELSRRSASGPGREYRIRALARLGSVDELGKALALADLSGTEAIEIVRALAERGEPARAALIQALLARVPETPSELAPLMDPPMLNVLSALLEGIKTPSGAKEVLTRLSQTPLPKDAARVRRGVLLRCAAARVLAERDIAHPALMGCDPDPEGLIGKLARLSVLGTGPLRGARATQYRALAADADPRVRQAALRMIAAHRELEDPALLFAEALGARAPGTRAVAAEVLSQYPDRANERRGKTSGDTKQPDPRVVEGLTRAIREPKPTDTVGVRTALLDAAAALGLLGVLSDLEKDCGSEVSSLRQHAERALAQLGRSGRRCSSPERAALPPKELGHLLGQTTRLVFETEVGELTLDIDPTRAPVAATRVVDLARSGFYDRTRVHRVVPGFVVQFGDREGDGYGGAPGPALRSEPSPGAFDAFAVGIAESGEDTGSSQLFVTLGRFPHLDGEATRVGHAGKGWERLIEGDRIVRVRIEK